MSVEAARPRHSAGAITAHRGNINPLTICLLFSIKWAPIIPRKEPKPSWRETQNIVVRAFTFRSSHTQCSGGQPPVKCFQGCFWGGGFETFRVPIWDQQSTSNVFYPCPNFFSTSRSNCVTKSLNWQYPTIVCVHHSLQKVSAKTQRSGHWPFVMSRRGSCPGVFGLLPNNLRDA